MGLNLGGECGSKKKQGISERGRGERTKREPGEASEVVGENSGEDCTKRGRQGKK